MIPLTDTPSLFSWQSIPLLPTIMQASQCFTILKNCEWQSSINSKVIGSNLQINSVSRKSEKLSISGEGEHVDSCRVPAHLLTPLSSTNKFEGKMHADTMQHSLDYGQTDHIASSTDYQHPILKRKTRNIQNAKFQQFLNYEVPHLYRTIQNYSFPTELFSDLLHQCYGRPRAKATKAALI